MTDPFLAGLDQARADYVAGDINGARAAIGSLDASLTAGWRASFAALMPQALPGWASGSTTVQDGQDGAFFITRSYSRSGESLFVLITDDSQSLSDTSLQEEMGEDDEFVSFAAGSKPFRYQSEKFPSSKGGSFGIFPDIGLVSRKASMCVTYSRSPCQLL